MTILLTILPFAGCKRTRRGHPPRTPRRLPGQVPYIIPKIAAKIPWKFIPVVQKAKPENLALHG